MNKVKLIGAAGMLMLFAGCATPVYISDGVRGRVFVPCSDDAFCFRNTYGIARENTCNEFPVTFRNNDYEFKSKRYDWVYQSNVVYSAESNALNK